MEQRARNMYMKIARTYTRMHSHFSTIIRSLVDFAAYTYDPNFIPKDSLKREICTFEYHPIRFQCTCERVRDNDFDITD